MDYHRCFLVSLYVIALLEGAEAMNEVYVEEKGDILRQSPPSLYRGGVIEFRWGDPEFENYDRHWTMYTLDGWKTTFTVEMSDINSKTADTLTFTEVIFPPGDNPVMSQLHKVTQDSKGKVFETSQQLDVDMSFNESKMKQNIRIRWISTPMETTAQWGYLNSETFQDGIPWPYGNEIDGVILNLVNAGSTSWSLEVNDTQIHLVEGGQLLTAASFSQGSTIHIANRSSVSSDFLIEWFPHAQGNHIEDKSSGCLHYKDTVPFNDTHTWLLKNITSPSSFPGASLKVTFFNISVETDDVLVKVVKLLVGQKEYLIARHSIAINSVYYIPVAEDSISLHISTNESFTLTLCYEPSNVTEFKALGYMRSDGYPDSIDSSHRIKLEGFPLPEHWSVTITLEKLVLPIFRAWLDLGLSNDGKKSSIVQTYTGSILGKDRETSSWYNRYPKTRQIWQNYYKDFGLRAGRSPLNELVSQFQIMKEATSRLGPYGGYSLKLEARLQTESEGVDTEYFVGNSGTINSSSPYYNNIDGVYYDVKVLNTTAYNAIEFTFGNSYTEKYTDTIEIYIHERFGKLDSPGGHVISGNSTGRILTYKSTHMTVKFKSDVCTEYKGFTINWRAVSITDPHNTIPTSVISTPSPTSTGDSVANDHQQAEEAQKGFSDKIIGIIVALAAVIILLLALLVVAVFFIIKYRKRLSDHDGHTPRHICTGDPHIGEDDYDLLNDETFGDIQEDFDWDAANILTGAGDEAQVSKLDRKVEELTLDEQPDDPAIITIHSKRLPSLSLEDNLKNIYDSHSPPAYVANIDDLLNPSKDIWGSPPSAGLDILPQAMAGKADSVRDAYLSTSLEKATGFPPASVAAKSDFNISLDTPVAMPKNAMTVEELERQMNSEPISVPKEPSSQKPPLLAGFVSPYQGGLMGTAPPPPGLVGSPQTRSPMSLNGMHTQRGQIPAGPQHRHAIPMSIRPVTILQRPANMEQQMHPMRGGPGFPPHRPMHGYNPPPGFAPRYPQLQRGRMPIPAMVRMPMGMPLQRHGMMQPRFLAGQHPQMYMPYNEQPRDDYSGILTQQEKDWLVKIQMIQLHTEDPYTDDYYYTLYNLEKIARSDSGSNKNSSLILPAMAKVETRQYTPMQFEGSLGRLTSSSVHKPRQVLDVGEKNDHLSHTATDTKKYRQFLFTAEKGYQLMLEVDELKKKMPSVPEGQQSGMQMDCQNKLMKIHQLVEENWTSLLNIRKGRSLIVRTLPLIDKHSVKHLMERLLGSLSYLIKKELADGMDAKTMRCLTDVLHHYDIKSLLQLSTLIVSSLTQLLATSFGCHLVMLMMYQAEKIYTAYVDIPDEEMEQWNSFVDKLIECISSHKSLPKLQRIPTAAGDHIAKRPNSDEVLAKVRGWLD